MMGRFYMREATRRWLDRAEEDLKLLSTAHVSETPNASGVLCQQAVEKTLKACWVELGHRPPMTHLLEELFLGIKEQLGFELNEDFLEELTPFGTETRYPARRISPARALWAAEFALETCAKLKLWLESRE
jgi:HEPN domain-containing protein